jgi:hypothetical protein
MSTPTPNEPRYFRVERAASDKPANEPRYFRVERAASDKPASQFASVTPRSSKPADKPADQRGSMTCQPGNVWRGRLFISRRQVGCAIDTLAAIAREDHRPDKRDADAKAELAEHIGRWIDKLQTLARDLDAHDLDG